MKLRRCSALSDEKDKYEIPEELKGVSMEYWTDTEVRRWVNQWSNYAGCQKLKRMMHEEES